MILELSQMIPKRKHPNAGRTMLVLSLALAISLFTGCAGYDLGDTSSSKRSYEGTTLNSPVTDQNPHPGGDSSYPSSVSDEGRVPLPPQSQQ